jgi:uncharacterized protein
MNKILENKLIKIAEERQTKEDPSHDFNHVRRVFNLAKKICKKENADLDVLIPAALFHDTVVYQKNHPNSKNETEESAKVAKNILNKIKEYPKGKISHVVTCIRHCSFSKGIKPESLESEILQDSDRLEATGAISIMRTFSSGGQMNRQFYEPSDPFCKKGAVAHRANLDLFYRRLLIVEKTMNTKLAKQIAKRRTESLKKFLNELKLELKESEII